jgi:Ca-activated chloride channel family protein
LPGNWLDCITFGRCPRAALVAASLLLLTGVGVRAQFTSGVNVVEVYVSVTDRQGQPVRGLSRGDFTIRENGVEQVVTTFTAGDVPLSVALALDRSFSMTGDRLGRAKTAARTFLEELKPGDESALLAIGSRVELVAPLSSDRDRQIAELSRLDAFGTTGLYDAVIESIAAVQPARGRRALVLLSDGDDRYSRASAEEAIAAARRSDVMIYAVAFGSRRPPLFAELATITGGRSFHVTDATRLPDTLRGIARELRQQYLLGYTPTRPIVAGEEEWRSISVSVRPPDVQVRARDGYLVR